MGLDSQVFQNTQVGQVGRVICLPADCLGDRNMKHISWVRHCAKCKETESFSKKLTAWWGRQTCSELENGVALDTNPGKRHKAGKGRKKEGRGEDDHCITGTQKGLDLTHCGKQEVPSRAVLQVTGMRSVTVTSGEALSAVPRVWTSFCIYERSHGRF